MDVSIFGLGYVGCVELVCSSQLGHSVIGVDISKEKVDLINQGKPTIIEKGIEDLCKQGYINKKIIATQDVKHAVLNSNISFITVGTPGTKDGHLDLTYIFDAAKQIGEALKYKDAFHIIAIRSTVLPGTNIKVGDIIENASGKKRNESFAIVSNPEFLREGTAIQDYLTPPYILVGSDNEKAIETLKEFYKDVNAEFISTDIRVAEIMKYVNNTYHALKVTFTNEVGNICKKSGIDSKKVMDIFCLDTKLNISPYYFKPGFAYGGSCLPKDTKALQMLAEDYRLDVPIISNITNSNETQKKNAISIITNKGEKNIGILGLCFKAGTDDLRSSPIIDVVKTLISDGLNIFIYDKNIKKSILKGINRTKILKDIQSLEHLIIYDNMDDVLKKSDVIVISNKEKEFKDIIKNYPHKIIIDLAHLWDEVNYDGVYEGISWSIDK
jgi:GDP-mannose 6-dehydrogenase